MRSREDRRGIANPCTIVHAHEHKSMCYFRMQNAGLQARTCCRQGLVFGKMLSFVFKNQTVEK